MPSNLVYDCLIFVAKDRKAANSIKELSELYSNICIQIAVTPITLKDLPSIIQISKIADLYSTIFDEQLDLEKKLEDIFSNIDEDTDGFISSTEPLAELDNTTQPPNIIDLIMKEMDTDNDGKIKFNEFCY